MYNIIGKLCTEVIALTKRYAVDRIEGSYAILVPDGEKGKLELPLSDFDLKVNTIVDVTFENDRPVSVARAEGEEERRLEKNKSRLHALFAKSKK